MGTAFAAAVTGVLSLASSSALAGVFQLYGSQTTDRSGAGWGLVKFDTNPVTGHSVRVGHGGLMFDMDFGPDSKLYAPGGSGLRRVNTTTGASTGVGSWGIGSKFITSLAFAPNGTLYGTDNEGVSTSLYTISLTTGIATPVGVVGDYVFGLDFLPGGRLIGAAGDIFEINPTTGTKGTTLIPFTGVFATALDYGADHVLRTVVPDFGTNVPDALYTIDLDAMGMTKIGDTTEPEMEGLASIPGPSASLALLAAMLGRCGRRRAPHASRP